MVLDALNIMSQFLSIEIVEVSYKRDQLPVYGNLYLYDKISYHLHRYVLMIYVLRQIVNLKLEERTKA